MNKNKSILSHLDIVAEIFPAPMYWEDANHNLIGGNNTVIQAVGAGVRDNYVGKSLWDIYPKEMADHIARHNEEVMRTGKILSQEETIEDMKTGEIKYFMAHKSPLRDDDGNIFGVVGTSIDITAEKEAERLEIENKLQKQSMKDQEKFVQLAEQLAHDIRSPLASLAIVVDYCEEIPEKERITLREATASASNIATSFLGRFKQEAEEVKAGDIAIQEEPEATLMTAVLLQMLADKGYEYKHSDIKLEHSFAPESHFAFIDIGRQSLQRSISNLLNNARDAFANNQQSDAQITLKLGADHQSVTVTISDNGKGMPAALVEKIKRGVSVSEGKEDGHGIGLTQVRETLARYHGKMEVFSTLGEGTDIVLTFPRGKSPAWIGESIELMGDDTIVVLDDDNSIHNAWDLRFASLLIKHPAITVKHFHQGEQALAFINGLSADKKNRVFLLSDYELLKQDKNGLEVIEASGLSRHLLVTSHYTNHKIRERAVNVGVNILPKQLATHVAISINKQTAKTSSKIVVIDDNKSFADIMCNTLLRDKHAANYQDPLKFLAELDQYSLDTLMFIDSEYPQSNITGIELAAKLHEKGYTRLYLLSGRQFKQDELPAYLTPILKNDIKTIKAVL